MIIKRICTGYTSLFDLLEQMTKDFSLIKLYFLIATIVWLFGTIIAYGIGVYSGLEYLIITDDEYITSTHNRWEIENCSQPVWKADSEVSVDRTVEEKSTCIAEATERLIKSRRIDFKMTLLQWGVWGTIFLILFLFHYPKFKKE